MAKKLSAELVEFSFNLSFLFMGWKRKKLVFPQQPSNLSVVNKPVTELGSVKPQLSC